MNQTLKKGAFLASLALLLLSNNSSSQPVNQIYTTPGPHTYTIPTGYTATIKVEAWGAGGGGGGDVNFPSSPGSGGGGGAYASKTYTLPAGNYWLSVGKGGAGYNATNAAALPTQASPGEKTAFDGGGGDYVVASGGGEGSGGAGAPGGVGGKTATSSGTDIYAGGNGGALPNPINSNQFGGGGGGSATASGAGGDGNVNSGGTGQGNGGNGGANTPNPGTAAQNGAYPGGGGGGKPISTQYLTGGDGADGKVIITVDSYLPVHFGPFAAELANNTLTVSFTTLQETNNDHFNLQSSQNGQDFSTIASFRSKHADGNANGTTEYHLTLDIAGKVSFALSLLALLGLGTLGFNRKTRVLMIALLLLGAGSFIVSCTKNTNELATGETGKAFLRIEQVDKNGHSTYSKVITITKE